MQQNEPFLPGDLQTHEGHPVKHRLTSEPQLLFFGGKLFYLQFELFWLHFPTVSQKAPTVDEEAPTVSKKAKIVDCK